MAALRTERLEAEKHARSQADAVSASQRADTREAYNGMLEAMSQWYAALAKLEGGQYDNEAISAAEAEMDKAQGLSERLEEPCRIAFGKYYNKGNFIKEHVEVHCKTSEQRQKVWLRHMKKFNDKLEDFKRECKRTYDWL
jgi:hypothetical protein